MKVENAGKPERSFERVNVRKRCSWANRSPIWMKYHDEEWGIPVHDDLKLFEMLILEGMSCGLSFELVLKKRAHMREVMDGFNPEKLINYGSEKITELMQDSGIIRNRRKVEALIDNAAAYYRVKEIYGSLDEFLWKYVGNKPVTNTWDNVSDIPVRTELSDRVSGDLKKHGFRFIGSVTIYSYMEAVGIINDHEKNCFKSTVSNHI
jgi:DNA-3-methyladenine glycosylase I